jgi:hypothetical protein
MNGGNAAGGKPMNPTNRIMDCLVSYFGLDDGERPTYARYFCYHVVAGPGPMVGSGVATVTILALHDESERCTSCQRFHTVKAGGPAAALVAAVRRLDAYHEGDHLRKVQSDIRGLAPAPASKAVPAPDAAGHALGTARALGKV